MHGYREEYRRSPPLRSQGGEGSIFRSIRPAATSQPPQARKERQQGRILVPVDMPSHLGLQRGGGCAAVVQRGGCGSSSGGGGDIAG